MAELETLARRYLFKSHKIAMLVIHGIGEQNPYETLDSFARGVFLNLTDRLQQNLTLEPLRIALKDWTQVGMRITVNPDQGADLGGRIDLFEYYWAPETEDKLSWKDTLTWLIRTDLTPLRYFADNLQVMMQGQWRRIIPALWDSVKLYLREILRVFLLYIPLAAGLLWLLVQMSHPRKLWSTLQPTFSDFLQHLALPNVLVLTCYALALLMIYFMIQSFGAYIRRRRMTIQGWAEGVWFLLAAGTALLFYVVGYEIKSRWQIDLNPLWGTVLKYKTGLTSVLGAVSGAAFIRYALTGYVADVAIYVTADAKSKNYAARTAILKGSTDALKLILANQDYDYVVLAGHSLGSVIAYDTINELLVEINGVLGPTYNQPSQPLKLAQIQKLKGLVTFGSPLDKTYYFFREHVKEDQAIRAQILSMLHSFRKVSSGRDYGPFDFTYGFLQLDDLVWVNAYALMDPVSGRLKFYRLGQGDQKSFRYWVPGLAHLSYWGDHNFYSYFIRKLLQT